MEKYIMPLFTQFQGLSDKTKNLIVIIGAITASIGPLFLILSKVVKFASFIPKILAMLSGPVGIVIVAVGALIAVLVYLYKTNDKFRKKVLAIWNKIKKGIIKAISAIKKWWKTNGTKIMESVKNVFEAIANAVVFSFTVIMSFIQKLVSSLLYLWENNKAFRDAIVGIWNGIKQAITSAISFIVAWWEENGARLWESIKSVFNAIWNVIVAVLDQIIKSVTVFLGYLKPIWEQIKAVFNSLWELIKEIWVLLEPLFKIIGGALVVLIGVALG